MSLTYVREISLTGGALAACPASTAGNIWVVNGSNKLQQWNLSAGTQVGSDITLAALSNSLALTANGASALSIGSGHLYLVDLTTSQITDLDTTIAAPVSNKGQQLATGAVYTVSAGNSTGRFGTFNSNTGAYLRYDSSMSNVGTNATEQALGNGQVYSVIAGRNGGFFFGLSNSTIVEMSSSLSLVSALPLQVDVTKSTNQEMVTSNELLSHPVYMAWVDPYLIVNTKNGYTMKIHWPTRTILEVHHACTGAAGGLTTASLGGVSGTSFLYGQAQDAGSTINNSYIAEIDAFKSPMEVRDFCGGTRNTSFFDVGVSGSYAYALTTSTTNAVTVYQVTPRTVTNKTTSITDGTAKSGRVIRIIDGGVGTAKVETDTAVGTTAENIPATSGKTIIEFAVYGEGTDEKGSVSIYTT